MIRKNLQFSQVQKMATDNSNFGKSQQLQPLNLEQLDVVSGGAGGLGSGGGGGSVPDFVLVNGVSGNR